MSHGREGDIEKRRAARYRKHDFHKGTAKDHAAHESPRLRQYRERMQSWTRPA